MNYGLLVSETTTPTTAPHPLSLTNRILMLLPTYLPSFDFDAYLVFAVTIIDVHDVVVVVDVVVGVNINHVHDAVVVADVVVGVNINHIHDVVVIDVDVVVGVNIAHVHDVGVVDVGAEFLHFQQKKLFLLLLLFISTEYL